MLPISNNPSYLYSIQANIGVISDAKTPAQRRQNNIPFNKYFQNKIKISSKGNIPAGSSRIAEFYGSGYGSVSTKFLSIGNTINVIEKPLNINKSVENSDNRKATNYSTSNNIENYKTPIGYYIIDTSVINNSPKVSTAKKNNPMKKRIDRAYHPGEDTATGSLVNITYY